MTLKQWQDRDDLREQLAQTLNSEVMQAAVSVLLESEASAHPVINPNVDLIDHAALRGVEREGFFRFLTSLRRLTDRPVPPPKELQPWVKNKLE